MLDETGLWRDVTGAAVVARRQRSSAPTGVAEVAALLGADGVRRDRGERERRRVLRRRGALARVAGGTRRPGGARRAERSAGARRLRVASRGRAAGRLLLRRVPRPDRGGRRGRARAVRRRDGEPRLDASARARAPWRSSSVPHQRAVTHTQAFCGAVVAALARVGGAHVRPGARQRAARLPEQVEATIAACTALGRRGGARWTSTTAIVFGSGPGWAAALEAALLLKEVAGIPAEGVETREGATSAMMALAARRLSRSACRPAPTTRCSPRRRRPAPARGAPVLRAPGGRHRDRRLAAVSDLPRRRRRSAHDRARTRARRRPAGVDGRVLPRRETHAHEPRPRRDRLRQRLRRARTAA